MQFLHTMVRISDIDSSLDFYCKGLGLIEVARKDSEAGRFTLIFLAAPEDLKSALNNDAPLVELTYNWDPEDYSGGRNFGHLAFRVEDINALPYVMYKYVVWDFATDATIQILSHNKLPLLLIVGFFILNYIRNKIITKNIVSKQTTIT